jgi:hypothetical protein
MVDDIDLPQPGDIVRHTSKGDVVGVILGLRSVERPTYIDENWSYVRFDDGVHNWVLNRDLAPQRGCRDFAGRPDVGI